MRRLHTLAVAVLLETMVAHQPTAAAQEGGFSLEELRPAPAGDAFFSVPSPYAAGHLELRGYAMFDYAHHPIRLAASGAAVVKAQGFVRADVSLALWDRLLASVDVPVAVVQADGDAAATGTTFTDLQAPELGDLRVGLRARLFGDDRTPVQLGLGSYFHLPTGSPEQYAGEGAVRAAFHGALGGRVGPSAIGLWWGATGGVELRGSDRPQALTYGVAAAVAFAEDAVQVGPELFAVTPLGGDLALSTSPVILAAAGTNAEVLLAAKARFLGGLTLGAGVGPGISNAIGTPTLRAVATIGWAPLPEAPAHAEATADQTAGDRDGDGTPDAIDACPDRAGEPSPDPSKDGCPPPDRDGDGVLDVEDACPTTVGVRSGDVTANGCPPDSDGDSFHDGIDACPTTRGEGHEDPKKNGCPSDRDDDGIADARDACPDASGEDSDDARYRGCPVDPDGDGIRYADDACPFEKGAEDPDPKQNGCPRFVRVTKDEIVISQLIEFETYGASLGEVVSPNSAQLLTEVRDVIEQHPEIERLEVQGHTDDSGDEAFNKELSQQRADAVLAWLAEHGIARERLVAKGYGFTRPIADNRTRFGRQQNRRVQFVIVKQRQKS